MKPQPKDKPKTYWAFISYSSKDRRWGEWLHRRLENYPIPPEFRGLEVFDGAVLGKNLRPVFRDRDELAGSSDLGAAIGRALNVSRFLVVLCSKNAAKSQWVNKEILDFQALGKGDRILALILDGEPNATAQGRHEDECFPPALRYPAEPIAGDLRKEGDGKARGFLKILAGISQLGFDDLYRRHERSQARKRMIAIGVAISLITIFAGLAGYARRQQDEAIAANKAKDVLLQTNREQLHVASMAECAVAVRRIENDDKWHEGVAHLARALDLEPDNYLAGIRLFSTLSLYGPRNQNYPCAILAHGDKVNSVRFSVDGAYVVTVSQDHTAQVWDVASGKRLGRPLQHLDEVLHAEFCLDETMVLTVIRDEKVLVWNALSGTLVARLPRHDGTGQMIQSRPDGAHLVTINNDHEVRTWDVVTGRLTGEAIQRDSRIKDLGFSADSATIVRFSPDGSHILMATDGELLIKNAATGELMGEPVQYEGEIGDVRFSADGCRIIINTGGRLSNNIVCLWDALTGKAVGDILQNVNPISDIDINSDGSLIAIASGNSVDIMHVAVSKPLGEPLRSRHSITGAFFSPDGARLVTTSYGKAAAQVWDAVTGQPVGAPLCHQMEILDAQFSPDGTRIITASDDMAAQIWSALTGAASSVLLRHQGPVHSARFNPSSTLVVTVCKDAGLIWDAATGKSVGVPMRHDGFVNFAQFSPNGKQIVTAGEDGTARLWDACSGKPIGIPLRHDGSVDIALFSPDGSRVVTVGGPFARRFVQVWSEVTNNPFSITLGYLSFVNDIQFSADGARIITAGNDRTVRIWESNSGKLIGDPIPQGGHNSRAALSPDNTLIVTTSEDGIVKGWDVATGKAIGEALCHGSMVTGVQFAPDGRRIVTAGEDGTARMFDVATLFQVPIPVPEWMREYARAIAGFEFNEDGELHAIDMKKRLSVLKNPPVGDERWADLARWLITPTPKRTLTPDSKFTFRQIAERERDTLLRAGLESALQYDTTVPLVRLLLANLIEKDEANKSVEARDAAITIRTAHLRRYDLDRLPEDPVLWARAVKALNDAPAGAMVGIGPKAVTAKAAAIPTAEKAIALLKDDKPSPARMNLAHAYLFNGQFEKAKSIHEKYIGTAFPDGRNWNDELRNDFKTLREAGQDHPDMKKIEAILNAHEQQGNE